MFTVSVVGASGYAGGELLRQITGHPDLALQHAMAAGNAGKAITALHPGLIHFGDRTFDEVSIDALADVDLVFFAVPHGDSATLASQLPETVKIVDLGADFRLTSAVDWKRFYSGSHAGTWTYGLSEFAREQISVSDRVANPGCYATAIALGAVPIADLVDGVMNVVATSGTTGAGRSSAPHLAASEVMGNVSAYKVGGIHQHTPEIEQIIRTVAGVERRVFFTPVLVPIPRGILAALTFTTDADIESLRARFLQRYEDEFFIHLLPHGVQPQTSATFGSNQVLLQVEKDERTSQAVVTVALDNLGKGAAGQAIQNANIMLGLTENAGLSGSGVRP